MNKPVDVVASSIMPAYDWLLKNKTNFEILPKKLAVLKKLGVPYSDAEVSNAIELARTEARVIVDDLTQNGVTGVDIDQEIVALIAYLQSLGQKVEGGAQ